MTNRELLYDFGYEDALIFENPDYDEAIIGVSYDGRVIYDYNLMVEHLMVHDGMTEMDAVEFIDYNTAQCPPPPGYDAPIIMYRI
jgi:hypothetical protein